VGQSANRGCGGVQVFWLHVEPVNGLRQYSSFEGVATDPICKGSALIDRGSTSCSVRVARYRLIDPRRYTGTVLRQAKPTTILIFLLISFVFACDAGCMYESSWRKDSSLPVSQPPAPSPFVKSEVTIKPDVEDDANKKFRVVPSTFEHVDFKNHSFGHYRLFSGKRVELTLKDGECWYDYPRLDQGWFALNDVYYADVDGDETPEAVVLLWHVQCGVSCDGGSALIYVYAAHKRNLRTLWRYETGSFAYGCGLKSFSLKDRQITVETFGTCPHSARDSPGSAKFVIENMTRSVFRFNGKRFVRRRLRFISAPARDVKNYKPEIRIS
jgi:hypothetical protein